MFDDDSINRFIHVGVDTSRYALPIGGRSSYPPLVKLLCLRSVRSVCLCVWLVVCSLVCVDYPRHGYVLYRKRIIQDMRVNNLYHLQG